MIRDTKGTRVVLGTLLVASFALVSIDSRSGAEDSPLHPVRATAAAVLAPLESGVERLTRPVTGTVGAVAHARSSDERIADLQEQNRALRAELFERTEGAMFAASVTELAASASGAGQRVVPARVIALAADRGYSWTVTLDVGSRDGVAPDRTVLDAAGLVGRVVAVTARTATVLLLADPISAVGVRMRLSGEIGTLEGAGDELARLTLFNRHATPAPGDQLVTFGSRGDTPFVTGVPVGEVVEVTPRPGGLGSVATVRPFARLSALDVVGVVVGPTGSGSDEVGSDEVGSDEAGGDGIREDRAGTDQARAALPDVSGREP